MILPFFNINQGDFTLFFRKHTSYTGNQEKQIPGSEPATFLQFYIQYEPN